MSNEEITELLSNAAFIRNSGSCPHIGLKLDEYFIAKRQNRKNIMDSQTKQPRDNNGRFVKKEKCKSGKGYSPDDYIKRLEEERDNCKELALTASTMYFNKCEEFANYKEKIKLSGRRDFADRLMKKDEKLWFIRTELLSTIDSLPFYRFFLKEKLQGIYSKIDSAWRI